MLKNYSTESWEFLLCWDSNVGSLRQISEYPTARHRRCMGSVHWSQYDTSPHNFWTTFLENDLTEKLKKSVVANAIENTFASVLYLFRSVTPVSRKLLIKPFYFYLSHTCGSLDGTPLVISVTVLFHRRHRRNTVSRARARSAR